MEMLPPLNGSTGCCPLSQVMDAGKSLVTVQVTLKVVPASGTSEDAVTSTKCVSSACIY